MGAYVVATAGTNEVFFAVISTTARPAAVVMPVPLMPVLFLPVLFLPVLFLPVSLLPGRRARHWHGLHPLPDADLPSLVSGLAGCGSARRRGANPAKRADMPGASTTRPKRSGHRADHRCLSTGRA